jgi:fibronectin-binding autotransporter adhesin
MANKGFKKTKFVSTTSMLAMAAAAALGQHAGIRYTRGDMLWTGGGTTTNWSDAGNWGGTAVTNSYFGTLTFNAGGTQGTTSVDDVVGANGNKLLWTGTSPWTLNGTNNISLYDNGGTQAKIENQSTGLVTINAPITFAATTGNAWGEINAVNGDITFGSAGTLTVSGSAVAGIKMFGSNHNTTFNNTVSASGKWFGMTTTNDIMNVGGSFTSGDIYVMNSGTLNLTSGGALTTTAIRLGGDFGNTGNQNQTLGGTFNLASLTGGQNFGSTINSVSGNTSGALAVQSLNSSGTNTISGSIFLDSALAIKNTAGGTLVLSGANIDIKQQTLTLTPSGLINITGPLTSDTGAGGTLLVNGAGTVIISSTGNTFSGTSSLTLNANSTQITGGATLGIVGDTSLGVVPNGAYNNIQFLGNGTLQDFSNNISLASTRNISIASGSTATFDTNGNNMTIAGIINGTGGAVTKTGTGTLTLSGANTYSGTTTYSAGQLVLASTSGLAISSGTLTLNDPNGWAGNGLGLGVELAGNNEINNSTIINFATAGTFNGFRPKGFSVTVGGLVGSGTQGVIEDTAFNSGATSVGTGTITLNVAGGTALSYNGFIRDNGGVTNNAANKVALVMSGSGTQTLSGGNIVYTGGTTVTAGRLILTGATGFASAVTVTNPGVLEMDSSQTFAARWSYAQNLSGNGIVNINNGTTGYMVWTANGGITLSGQINIMGGVLGTDGTVNSFSANTASLDIAANAALDVRGSTINQFNALTGSGKIIDSFANGTNTVTVGVNNGSGTFSGQITQVGDANTGTSGSPVVAIIKAGTGTQTLSGTNTYTGGTTITGGVLSVTSLAATGTNSSIGPSGTLTLNGGTLQYTTAAAVGNANSSGFDHPITVGASGGTFNNASPNTGNWFITFNSVITGSGPLTFTSSQGAQAGFLVISNSPSFSGLVNVNGFLQDRSSAVNPFGTGTLTINTGGILTADNGGTNPSTLGNPLVFNGGTLQSQSAPMNYTGSITLNTGTTSFLNPSSTANITLSGNISGSGTLTEGGGSFSVVLAGNNSGFNGTYNHTAAGATLFNTPNSGSAAASWTLSGSRYMYNNAAGGTVSLGALSGTTGLLESNTNVASFFSIGALNTNTTFGGTVQNLTGTVGILKVGNGTLTFTGADTYTGGTTVSAGTLSVASGGTLASAGTLFVASGATFTTSTNNTFGNPPTGAWTINGTMTSTANAQTMPGSVTLNGGAMTGTTAGTFGVFLAPAANTTLSAIGSGNTISAASVGLTGTLTFNTPATTDLLSVSAALGQSSALAGGIIKTGNGTVTLSGNGTYTGGTTVNGGVLNISGGAGGPSPVLPGPSVTVSSGGTLNFTIVNESGRNISAAISLAGTGSTGQGALSEITTAATLADFQLGSLTLAADATIGVTGIATDIFSGIHWGETAGNLNLNGHTLTISGGGATGGAVTIWNDGSNYVTGSGGITLANGGNLAIHSQGQSWTNTVTMNSGSAFIGYGNITIAAPITVGTGTATVYSENSTPTFSGSVSLTGTLAMANSYYGSAGTGLNLSGNITGTGALLNSSGVNTITGSNSYSGGTTVSSGQLIIGNNQGNLALPVGTVTIASGGNLNFVMSDETNRALTNRVFNIAGTGNTGQGALTVTNSGNPSDLQIGSVTLTADATIATLGTTNNFNSGIHFGEGVGGTLNLSGHTLTILGGGGTGGFAGIWAANYITGAGAIVVGNGGNFLLDNQNQTWTNTVTLNSGSSYATFGNISVASPISVAAGAATIYSTGGTSTFSGNIALTGTLNLANSYYGGTGTGMNLSGVISGTGTVVNASGLNTVSNANTFTGPLIINGGVFSTNNLATVGNAQGMGKSSSLTLNGGTFQFTNAAGFNPGGSGFAPTITLGASGGTLDITGGFVFYGGTLAGSGQLNVTNSANSNAAWLLVTSASPAFTGNIVIGNGVGTQSGIQYRSTLANALGSGTITLNTGGLLTSDGGNGGIIPNNIIMNGGTIGTQSVSVTYSGSVSLQANSFIGTPPGTGNSTAGVFTISGPISGTAGLTKNTADTGILSGSSTYTGGTSIVGGSLIISSTGSLGNTAISVTNSGSTFAPQPGSGTISLGSAAAGSAGATLNLASGTIFSMTDGALGVVNLQQQASFGAATTALTLAGATLNFDISSAGTDKLAVGVGKGAISGTNIIGLTVLGSSLANGTYSLITANQGMGGTFQFSNGATAQTLVVGATPYLLTLGNSATAETVTVAGAASTSLTWTGQTAGTGAADSSWNTTGSSNWATGALATNYVNGLAVIFQDTNTVTSSNVTNGTVTVQAGGVSPSTLTFNNSAVNYTVGGGAITGTTSLTKGGSGTVILTGANSYNGGTTITGGVLQIGNAAVNGTIGSGTYNMVSGSKLYLNYATAAAPTWANITGAGTLELNSAQGANGTANWGAPALPAGFTGTLKLDIGRINAVPANLGGATTVVIGNGGQFLAFDGTTNGTAYNYTQNFSINGMGWGEGGQNFGALRASQENATFSGSITLTGNSGLYEQSNVNSTLNVSGVISDGGSGFGITITANNNPITLNGAASNTYTGTTTASTGALILSKTGGAVAIPGNLAINSGANVWATANNQLGGVNTIVSNGNNTAWGAFTLLGTTQTIAGMNNANNTLMVADATISQTKPSPSDAGTGTLILVGTGSYANNGDVWDHWGGTTGTLAMVVNMGGGGTQTLSGAQIIYSGGTTINTGTLQLQDTTAFASAISVGSSGTLNLVRTATGFASRSSIAGNAITSSGIINVNNSGSGISGGWVILGGGTSTFTGTINVNSGVFATDALATLAGSATVNVASGGVFSIHDSTAVTIGGLNGAGDVTPAQGTAGATWLLTIGANNASGSFSGIIHGNNSTAATDGSMEAGFLALTKTGTGTQTLNGSASNTFGGTLTINNGLLVLGMTGGAVAVPGNLSFGNGSASINPTINTTQPNQFGTGTVITFLNSPGGYTRLQLLGNNQSMAGLSDSLGAGVVQDGGLNLGATTNATLTLNSSSNYSFNGFFRNLDAGSSGGTLSLIKNGTGTQTLTGGNVTYTGGTTITGGALQIGNNFAFNSAINIGSSGTLLLNIALGDIKLLQGLSGSGPATVVGNANTERLGGNDSGYTGTYSLPTGTRGMMWDAANSGSAGATWNLSGSFAFIEGATNGEVINLGALSGTNSALQLTTFSGSGVNTFAVGALNTNTTFAGLIKDISTLGGATGTATIALNKVGTGTLTLTGASTYTAGTTLTAGVLNVGSADTPGTSGPLGASGAISFAGGTLQFSAANTNDYSGRFSTAGSQSFKVDTNNQTVTFASPLQGSGSSLTKVGPGKLILTGTSTYTGGTTVSSGVLAVNGQLGNTAVTVTSGAVLTGVGNGSTTGVFGGNVTVNANAGLDFSQDGLPLAIGSGTTVLTLNGGLSLVGGTGSSDSSYLTFNGNSTGTDLIQLNSGVLTVTGAGGSNVIVNVNSNGLTSGTYTLIGYGSESNVNGVTYTLGTKPAGLFSTLSVTDNTVAKAIQLTIVANATPASAFWSGAYNSTNTMANGALNSWGGNNTTGPVTNWSDSTGTLDTMQVPGSISDVVFSAAQSGDGTNGTSGASLVAQPISTVLDTAYSINSLTVNSTPASVVVGGSQTLTINALASAVGGQNYSAGTGIVINSGAGTVDLTGITITPANDQSWANNSSSLLSIGAVTGNAATNTTRTVTINGTGSGGTTISGVIGDGIVGGKLGMVINAGGTTTFTGSNTYNGGTTIASGTLNINADTALGGATHGVTFTGNGTLQAGANNIALVSTRGIAITSGVNATIDTQSNAMTVAGVISGAGSLTMTGTSTGTLTANAANTFGGPLTINTGVFATNNYANVGSAQGIGENGNLFLNGGTFRYTGGSNGNPFAPTINIGASGGTLDTTTGFIFFNGSLAGSGNVNFIDSANTNFQWLLTGNSPAYTGNITIGTGMAGSGWVQYRSANASPLGSGTITINTGGIFSADAGSSTPSALSNNFILNGGRLGTQGSAMVYSGNILVQTNSIIGNSNGQTAAFTLSGIISGAAGLTKDTGNVVTINNSNSYAGGTTVSGGQLNINNAAAIGTGTLTLTGGNIDNTSGGAITLANNNAQVWNANFTFGGSNDLNMGTGNVALGSADRIIALNGHNLTVGGVISGGTDAGLILQGGGTMTLTGANTFSGKVFIGNSGANTLIVPAISALGTPGATIANDYLAIQNGGTLVYTGAGAETITGRRIFWNTGAANVNLTNASANLTFDVSTAGATRNQAFTKKGPGTLTISQSVAAEDSYTGSFTISGGTLGFNAASAGTIISLDSNVTGAAGTFINVSGPGTVRNSALTANWSSNLAGMNVAGGSTFDIRGNNTTVDALNGAGSIIDSFYQTQSGIKGDQLTVGINNGSGTFSGVISGTGTTAGSPGQVELIKTGTGVQTLTGANTYHGTTTVNGGTLYINGNQSTATGAVNVNNTNTILGGSGTTGGSITLASGTHMAPGDVTGNGTFTTLGSVTALSGALFDFSFNGTPAPAQLISNGLSLNGNLFNLYNAGGNTPFFTPGTYQLIDYNGNTAGSIGGTGLTGVDVGNKQSGLVYQFSTSINPGWLDLVIIGHGNATWLGGSNTDQNWSNPANWKDGTIAGETGSTTDTDTATFNAAPAVSGNGTTNPVIVDAGRNLKTIKFDPTADPYVIGTTGGNALLLTGGGFIQIDAGVTNNQTVNAPLILEGATYTFSNGATSGASLNIGGSVSSADAGDGATELTITGTSINTISGSISDGAATVSIKKLGSGTWILSASNSYSGGTMINGGTLQTGNVNALGTSDVTFTGAATLALAATGTSQTYSNNVFVDGSSATFAVTNARNATLGNLDLSQSLSPTMTVNLTSSDGTGNPYTLTLGAVTLNASVPTNTFNVANSTSSGAGKLVVGAIDDLGFGANLTKTGAGTMVAAADNTYLGGTTVTAGNLILMGNNAYSGDTTITGGTLTLAPASGNNNIASSPNIVVGSTAGQAAARLDVSTMTPNGGFTLASQTLAGFGTVIGNVNTSSTAILSPGGVFNPIGTTTFSGNLNVVASTTLNYDFGTPGAAIPSTGLSDRAAVSGTLTLPTTGSVTLNLTDNAGANGKGSLSNGTYVLFTYGSLSGGNGTFNNTFTVGNTPLSNNALAVRHYTFINDSTDKQVDLSITNTPGVATANYTDQHGVPNPDQLTHNKMADDSQLFLDGYALTANVSAGDSYTGMGSTVVAVVNGGTFVGTTAKFLAGSADGDKSITMNWRDRSVSESTPNYPGGPMAHPYETLISDVVLITGMGLNNDTSSDHVQTDIFALSMDYDPTKLPASEALVAASGKLYLGWLDTIPTDATYNHWINAVAGNFGGSAVFEGAIAFNPNTNFVLGEWGVDTMTHTVWAVLNHNSEFAVVVPEPTSLGLLGLGALSLLSRRRNPDTSGLGRKRKSRK